MAIKLGGKLMSTHHTTDLVSYVGQPAASTFVELLRWRAQTQPDKVAYTFLVDGEREELTLTYQQLDQQARAIAVQLAGLGAAGERALLLYPPGLDFIGAYFGCLYAGVVAVSIVNEPLVTDERCFGWMNGETD
jgi:acyl-CoA synthetase (AMP-forming)/AMP-acid ligase II